MNRGLTSVSKTLILLITWILSTTYYFCILLQADPSYSMEPVVLLLCNTFMIGCLFVIWTRTGYYIFEPIVFVFFLYYMIFVYEPIANLSIGNVAEFGVNTMPGCIKATVIFCFSFVFMLIGYYYRRPNFSIYCVENNKQIKYDRKALLKICWILWGIGVGSFLLYNVIIGRSAIYMLSFGMIGSAALSSNSYSVQILTTIIYISFVPLLCILFYEKRKILKIIAFYFTCAPLATRGFRNVVLVVIMAPIVFSYAKKKKTPSFRALIGLLAIAIFVFGFLGTTRGATRTGQNIDLSNYEFSSGAEGMLYYFDSYKVFYGAVTQYPSNYNYTMGIQLLYAVVMFIPRALWPGKPDTPIREVIANSVGPLSASSGSAWPNIGEYYTDLGITGTMIIMLVLGVLLRKMKKMYESPNADEISLMLYSIYWPALVTIIAYGYTAGNMPQFVIMAIPVFIIRKFVRRIE